MKCIIIDDDLMSRAIITELITTRTTYTVAAEFDSAIQAIKYLNKKKVDLIFLDIHMPDFNGFDFIDTLKDKVNIVLVTSDKEFAINAFEYHNVVDYLVKPITEERFDKTIQKIEILNNAIVTTKKLTQEKISDIIEPSFYINIGKRLIKIDANSILYFQAKGDYVAIKTENNNYTVHNSLKKIESKLPIGMFFKSHRSYMININKIIDIEENTVLIGKDVLPVSRRNRPELMKNLKLL
ncbi:MAG: LytTR family DNA-binding domain-containing protein [Flavobacterium sp.]|nr:LytTR family DNA-binding domain-containing protein [Flavobacterium sp.]